MRDHKEFIDTTYQTKQTRVIGCLNGQGDWFCEPSDCSVGTWGGVYHDCDHDYEPELIDAKCNSSSHTKFSKDTTRWTATTFIITDTYRCGCGDELVWKYWESDNDWDEPGEYLVLFSEDQSEVADATIAHMYS